MSLLNMDIITGALSFIITLMILSYLIGDNPLFRIAVYLFTGVSAGYIASVAMWRALFPLLIVPLVAGETNDRLLAAIALIGVGLIFMKAWPRTSKLGAPAMAYLAGVGSAIAIGGGLTGTLLPQIGATISVFEIVGGDPGALFINGVFVIVGTIASLAYFHFGARHKPDGTDKRFILFEGFAWIGQIFIAITLGMIFAGVYAAALTAFIERISSILRFLGIT